MYIIIYRLTDKNKCHFPKTILDFDKSLKNLKKRLSWLVDNISKHQQMKNNKLIIKLFRWILKDIIQCLNYLDKLINNRVDFNLDIMKIYFLSVLKL